MIIPDLSDARIWPVYAALAVVTLLVGLLGGKPERLGLLTLLLMFAAQWSMLNLTGGQTFFAVDWASVVTDGIGLAGFSLLMLNARRDWPIVAWSLQLISLLGHFVQGLSEVLGYTYVALKTWPTMAVIVLVLVGTAAHQYRKRRDGDDPDWTPFRQFKEYRQLALRNEDYTN